MRRLRFALISAIIVSAAYAAYAYVKQDDTLPLLASRCAVGLQGAAVSVEVEGSRADRQCEAMAGEVTAGGSWYRYASTTEPGGAVICQYTLKGNTWTVRDQGFANIYGSEVCQNLNELAFAATVPTPVSDEPGADPSSTQNLSGRCQIDCDESEESCTLALVDHDVRIHVSGDVGVCDTVRARTALVGPFVRAYDADPSSTWFVCAGAIEGGWLEVWDSGGAYYGDQVCRKFHLYLD